MHVGNKRMPRKILLIFILGLTLRFGCVLFFTQFDETTSDSYFYTKIAKNLTLHQRYASNGEPDVYWAPGYPFFLSVIYKIFGINNTAVRVVQSILSALVIFFVYFICKKIFNCNVGVIAAAITSVYPGFIGYSGLVLPQLFTMFLNSLFILLIINLRMNMSAAVVLGLIAGYSALIRSELMVLYLILFLLVIHKERKQIHKFFITAFITMCLIMSIWSIRNYRVFNKFIPVSTHYADTLWLSTWHEEWLEWPAGAEPFASMVKGKDCVGLADFYFKAAMNNIKEHPFIYLKMCTKRLYRFWLTGHSNTFYFMKDSFIYYLSKKEYAIFFVKLVMLFFNVSIILLGFFGIRVAYKNFSSNRNIIHYIFAPILFYIALHFFIFATPRYAIPIMPFVIIFASCAIVHFWSLLKE